MTVKLATKMSDLEYLESIIMKKLTKDNKNKENARRCTTLKFNDAEWEEIERGAKWLWAAEVISKPTAYSFLKWCGLTVSALLEKRHGDDDG